MIKAGLIPIVGAAERLSALAAEGFIPLTCCHVPDRAGGVGSIFMTVAKFDDAGRPAAVVDPATPPAEPAAAPAAQPSATSTVRIEPPPVAASAPAKKARSRKRPSKNGHKAAEQLPEPTVIPTGAQQ